MLKLRRPARIEGVKITKLKTMSDERGFVKHMLRNDDEHFEKFGEIYFSGILPGVVKAWHLHKTMALNYAVVWGEIKLVLIDNRDSGGHPLIAEIILNSSLKYKLVTIPPGIWNGFRTTPNSEQAIVANCTTEPHSPNEIMRVAPESLIFGGKPIYDWGEYDHGG